MNIDTVQVVSKVFEKVCSHGHRFPNIIVSSSINFITGSFVHCCYNSWEVDIECIDFRMKAKVSFVLTAKSIFGRI